MQNPELKERAADIGAILSSLTDEWLQSTKPLAEMYQFCAERYSSLTSLGHLDTEELASAIQHEIDSTLDNVNAALDERVCFDSVLLYLLTKFQQLLISALASASKSLTECMCDSINKFHSDGPLSIGGRINASEIIEFCQELISGLHNEQMLVRTAFEQLRHSTEFGVLQRNTTEPASLSRCIQSYELEVRARQDGFLPFAMPLVPSHAELDISITAISSAFLFFPDAATRIGFICERIIGASSK